ncbi:MAG: hypothetical protein ACI92B_002221, partial [Marinobacter maritimus]
TGNKLPLFTHQRQTVTAYVMSGYPYCSNLSKV